MATNSSVDVYTVYSVTFALIIRGCDVFEKSERNYEWFCIQHLCPYAKKNSCCLYKEKEGMKVAEFSLEIFFYFRD